MSRVFVLAIAAVLCLAARASAQTAVLFPVGGDETLAVSYGAEALGRVQRDLEDSSFTVLAGPELARAMSAASAAACSDPSCAGPMLTALHAELAVGVALWHRNGLVQVSVVLVDPSGVTVSADADGAASVVGQATQSALSQARARWATREGSPIRVVGSPEGATITVDHEPWGTLPHEGSLSPGTHHFVVSADGHVSERRDVEISAGTETVEISFALAPGSDTPPAVASGADVGLIVAGAVTAAAGLGALIAGIAIATAPEHCVSGCMGPAADRHVAVPATDLGMGLSIGGGVVVGVGIVLMIVGAMSNGASSSAVSLDGRGLTLRF